MSKKSWFHMQAAGRGHADIYIYDEIGGWGISAKDFATELKGLGQVSELTVHINSPGGSVFDGAAIYNLLAEHEANITTRVDGLAASMASIIFTVGDVRIMPENSLLMIHNPRMPVFGEAKDLKKAAELLDKVRLTFNNAYLKVMNVESDVLNEMLDEETWLSAEEATAFGLATQLSPPIELAASFDLSKLDGRDPRLAKFEQHKVSKPFITSLKNIAENLTAEQQTSPRLNEEVTMTHTVNEPDVIATNHADDSVSNESLRDRNRAIIEAFKPFPQLNDLQAECLADVDLSLDDARTQLLAKLGEQSAPSGGGFHGSYIDNGHADKDAMVMALQCRAHLTDRLEVKDLGAYQTMSLLEMARAALQCKGIGTASYASKLELVGAAFTHSTSDFGNVLMDVAHKAMLRGYEEAQETFQQWTYKGSLSDFKVTQRVALNAYPSLSEVKEGAEYSYGTVGDRAEPIMLATYGKLFTITRQAIINDDLQVFTRIPMLMGRAAIRTVGDLVYAVLTSNPKLSSGTELFHASHKNLLSGASSALSVNALDKARSQMATQKREHETALNIRPAYLLIPAALEGTAKELMESSSSLENQKNSGVINKVRGMAQVISEGRLDAANPASWYLAANPSMHDTVEVAYLDGNDRPYLEQQEGFTVDGVASKVRIDAGVKALDYMGLFKGNGQ
ncbi:ClpP-like prohead protease/major capsid protein fusion protein [Pleionea sediminis]|uniref:ClpP-like prohead protease/major capsid protein fusion protein n=1 Tax=Pleionea sediminis TaxID=2569479 RepID=UPI00197BDE9E|nr:ClpP-like prohead protease/major capsid protein fusion protein [Pleionea sediminis]